MGNSPGHSGRRPSSILALCLVLWLLAAALAVLGLWWLTQPGSAVMGGTVIAAALLAFLAGVGLFQMRRWGVALFAGLTMIGSINHIVNAIQRFNRDYAAEPGAAISSMLGVLAAFLVPLGFIYLTLAFWRRTR